MYPVHKKILICGRADLTPVIILSTSSRFSSHNGSPPSTEKFLIISLAQIALIICPRISVGNGSPPLKSHVSGLKQPGQWCGYGQPWTKRETHTPCPFAKSLVFNPARRTSLTSFKII